MSVSNIIGIMYGGVWVVMIRCVGGNSRPESIGRDGDAIETKIRRIVLLNPVGGV